MSKLLPNRHPNKDFFIVDVKDASPKDDLASMEHPVYSLSTKPDMRELEYTGGKGQRLRVIPSGRGLATIMDKDIVLYCISKLVAMKDEGNEISPVVEASAHEIMVACNWMTSKPSYERFENAMLRLNGTQIVTDIETGGEKTTEIFKLIDSAAIIRKEGGEQSPFGRLSNVRIKLSDWTFRAVQSMEVLSINPEYFRLRRPLERRMYELARKHIGNEKSEWRISVAKLQAKMGSNAPLKKFRLNVREIIRDENLPDYGVSLTDNDVVVFTRKSAAKIPKRDVVPLINVRPDTVDKIQAIAAKLRMSYTDLYGEWCTFCHKKKEELQSPDAAFMAFAKQKLASRPAHKMSETMDQAGQLGLLLGDIVTKTARSEN